MKRWPAVLLALAVALASFAIFALAMAIARTQAEPRCAMRTDAGVRVHYPSRGGECYPEDAH